ncbi:MAG: hypothetical protein JXA20_17445 [Spirochaetes bacterium]|nr:hypothetical protein [Spirochaetota bacterium]
MIFFHELKQSAATLLPGSSLMKSVFRKNYSTAAGLNLSPAGGEAYGDLLVAAVSSDEAPEIDEVVLILWKISNYFPDESLNKNWDEETIAYAGEEYRKTYESWLSCSERKGFIEWLNTNARAALRAQREMEKPLNQPFYFPEKKMVDDVGLESLDFINEGSLCVILQNDWNDIAGLFKYDTHWILASWSTSA